MLFVVLCPGTPEGSTVVENINQNPHSQLLHLIFILFGHMV